MRAYSKSQINRGFPSSLSLRSPSQSHKLPPAPQNILPVAAIRFRAVTKILQFRHQFLPRLIMLLSIFRRRRQILKEQKHPSRFPPNRIDRRRRKMSSDFANDKGDQHSSQTDRSNQTGKIGHSPKIPRRFPPIGHALLQSAQALF